MFCTNCGKEIDNKAVVCIGCGCATKNVSSSISFAKKDKGIAIILAFFLGNWGIVRFYLNDIKGGTTLLIISSICLLLSWLIIPGIVMFIIWLLELIRVCKLNEDDIQNQ